MISYADNVFPQGLKVPNGGAAPEVITPPVNVEETTLLTADTEGETPAILTGAVNGATDETETVTVLDGNGGAATNNFEIPEEVPAPAPATT